GRMDASALIVANGLALEEGLDDTIEASSDRGTPVFRFSDHIAGLEGAADGVDPHIWFDPTLVAEALPALADALVEHVALDEVSTRMCMEEYQRELADLDREIQQLVAEVPADNRKLVTNHDSLHYFADRYGFEVIGTVIPAASTLAETNPAQLEGLATLIDDNGIPAIFVEALQSTDDADVLARRVGVQVVRLDTGTLGPEGEGADSYIGLLRTTAELISGALD
ncbi:MAG: metal ABC transporter solute-binding protein, Zn/Mn family, partial [Acidimicrobiales bacterium]